MFEHLDRLLQTSPDGALASADINTFTSRGGKQVDRSEMFPPVGGTGEAPRSRVLQLFKCATRQNPTRSLLNSTRQKRPTTAWDVWGNQPTEPLGL